MNRIKLSRVVPALSQIATLTSSESEPTQRDEARERIGCDSLPLPVILELIANNPMKGTP